MIKIAFDFVFRSHLFVPKVRVRHFKEIQTLVERGQVEMILTDKDDTISRYRQFQLIDGDMRASIRKIEEKGVIIKVISNGIKEGDPSTIEHLEIVRTQKKKPFNGGELEKIIQGRGKEKVWVVGDRLMTDIYLANLMGCSSVLVHPL